MFFSTAPRELNNCWAKDIIKSFYIPCLNFDISSIKKSQYGRYIIASISEGNVQYFYASKKQYEYLLGQKNRGYISDVILLRRIQ